MQRTVALQPSTSCIHSTAQDCLDSFVINREEKQQIVIFARQISANKSEVSKTVFIFKTQPCLSQRPLQHLPGEAANSTGHAQQRYYYHK